MSGPAGPGSPVIMPVNHTVVDGTIVYRTADGTTPPPASHQVTLEVDRADDAFSAGRTAGRHLRLQGRYG